MILLRIVVVLNNTEELARHLQVSSLADVCAGINSFMKELDTNEFHATSNQNTGADKKTCAKCSATSLSLS